ncbi:hypothetical protein MASR2M15_15520 [Anaerolineales bacterium]
MNWLIAEDEPDIRNLVVIMCQVWGHKPLSFESGQKVWDYLDEIEQGKSEKPLPEFALMDIRMPGYRGDEVAKRIRQTEGLTQIPIVLMTAFVLDDTEQKEMMKNTGVDAIIYKPLPEFNELRKILERVIAQKNP